jgi:hypothetical protein
MVALEKIARRAILRPAVRSTRLEVSPDFDLLARIIHERISVVITGATSRLGVAEGSARRDSLVGGERWYLREGGEEPDRAKE